MADYTFLETFYFSQYRIYIKALEKIKLPFYKGFALRGAFGHALRKTVCIRKQTECPDCLIRSQCPYSLIMGSPVKKDHPHFKKYNTPQRPYVIVPPLEQKTIFPREKIFSFGLVLIGKMETYIPHFIYAFTKMGESGLGQSRGRFALVSIDALPLSGTPVCIYYKKTEALRMPGINITFSEFKANSASSEKITLSFLTPFRIKVKNKLTANFSFSLFYTRLLERLMVLNHFFCNGRYIDIDTLVQTDNLEIKVINLSLQWIDLERYSNKQQGKMKMGGVIGTITFQGPITRYLPILQTGEYVHAGKGTSFGFGKYTIQQEEL